VAVELPKSLTPWGEQEAYKALKGVKTDRGNLPKQAMEFYLLMMTTANYERRGLNHLKRMKFQIAVVNQLQGLPWKTWSNKWDLTLIKDKPKKFSEAQPL